MAGIIGKLVYKKILKETIENKFGKTDALFESTPARRMSHVPAPKLTSNRKKLRKALPPGLSEADQETLVKVKRRAYMLDMSLFSLCGLRFGWSSVLGLIPAVGDVFDMLLALLVIRAASECNLPNGIRMKMMFNVILDFLVGLVPILGDLADAAYKANTRNAIILENYLRERGAENIKQQGRVMPADMSLPEEYDHQQETGTIPPPPPPSYGATTGGPSRPAAVQGGGRRDHDVERQQQGSRR
ncbi:hypothetical protein DFH27DRAFT_5845 [Peziza echinospora]|nr:hypothetical protein DFH27DRAFT_5845 [Peziza echinospora]